MEVLDINKVLRNLILVSYLIKYLHGDWACDFPIFGLSEVSF